MDRRRLAKNMIKYQIKKQKHITSHCSFRFEINTTNYLKGLKIKWLPPSTQPSSLSILDFVWMDGLDHQGDGFAVKLMKIM